MYDTLARILSDVVLGLGNPAPELLSEEEAFRAVSQVLSLRLQQLQQSDQNINVMSFEFTLNGREQIITGVPGLGVPAWVDRQRFPGTAPIDIWDPIWAVNLSQIEDYRRRGVPACAFYGTNGQQIIKFSYNPPYDTPLTLHRLWYDPNPLLAQTLNSTSGLPENFNVMISAEAQLRCIPTMLSHAAQYENTDRPVTPAQKEAWQALAASLATQVAAWDETYREYKYRSRGDQRGRNRRSVLAGGGDRGFFRGGGGFGY